MKRQNIKETRGKYNVPSPTADKRKIKDFPKLPSATSFIRKTLYEMAAKMITIKNGGK